MPTFLRLGAASIFVSVSDADGFRVVHGTDNVTLLHVPPERVEKAAWDSLWETIRRIGINGTGEPEDATEWFAEVVDDNGDRLASEVFGGDYSMEQIREQALRHFDPPPGHTIRFRPIGEDRAALAIGIA